MPRAERPLNAGQAFGMVVADELVRHGITDAVIAPGSRSTPLALALLGDQRLRVHVRIDERSASYLALGLSRGSGRPVPVLCTSGTAAAHFHAAVLEADQARVPLLVLTADRPPELRGTGANQTIDQVKLYGDAVRWFCETGVPESRTEAVQYWRSLVSRAVATSVGATGGPAGPVHLNIALREPLVPTDDGIGFPHDLAGRGRGEPWTAVSTGPTALPDGLLDRLTAAGDGVVVAGDGLTAAEADAVVAFADRSGWPLLAEPHSNARRGGAALVGHDYLLDADVFTPASQVGLALVAGRLGLSRAMAGWLARTPHVVVDRDGAWADPTRQSLGVFRCTATALHGVTGKSSATWLSVWQGAAAAVTAAVDGVIDGEAALTEPGLARDLSGLLPAGATLVVASSMPIRDLDLVMRPRDGLRVIANRGVSGIDGFVSTAVGVALSETGPTYALSGDLSLLHDVNGLLVGADEPRPDLTIVVVSNDGGGIFSLLPQAGGDAAAFERLFGTPHGLDIGKVGAAYGVRHSVATTYDELAQALAPPRGLRLVEVRTDRAANADLHARMRQAATSYRFER